MIGILDLNLGNIGSVKNAVYSLGFDYILLKDRVQFDDITHLILPGVGTYKTAMENFEGSGLRDAFYSYVESKRPLLGICLGMQILSDEGTEIQLTKGLGLIKGRVDRFRQTSFPLPHVGWNEVERKIDHPVFHNIKKDVDFYFVHSYHFSPQNESDILALTDYGYDFVSAVIEASGKPIIGTQFHPEKSQANGLKLLDNFCSWNGKC
jgi:glutamine amidotransferase